MPYMPPIKPANERRRTDIDPATTWVVSDTHFGHTNIVGYCFRPEDHEEVMIAEWRAHVPDDATVLHLGDLSYGHNGGDTRFKRIIAPELTGKRKLLVRGNHDRKGRGFYTQAGFTLAMPFSIDYGVSVVACDECNAEGWVGGVLGEQCPTCRGACYVERPHVISFSHYPWNDEEDGGPMGSMDWRVHGHIHNNGYTRDGYVPFLRNHINISAEQTKYRPVNLQLLLDAAVLGKYPRTTDEQLAEAAARRAKAQRR